MKLTVVSPTYQERENVAPLIEELVRVLQGIDFEVLIVDDASPDGTADAVAEIGAHDARVRVLRREGVRALSAAVIDGFSDARGEVVACMDADLQHDPSILPEMLRRLDAGADLVAATRYSGAGGTGDWSGLRRLGSRVATRLAQAFIGVRLSDPMSGYFMLRKADFLRVRRELDGRGFKILLEIVARLGPHRIAEVPFTFRSRRAGRSKLDSRVLLAYARQLWRLRS